MSKGAQSSKRGYIALAASTILLFLATACVPAATSSPAPPTSASRWSMRPDAAGRHYAGNETAAVVVEEWSDFQ